MNTKNKNNKKGFAVLVSILIVTAVSSIFVASFLFNSIKTSEIVNNEIKSVQSYYAAEAGIEDSIYRIRNNKLYSSSNSFKVGSATSTINISESGGVVTISTQGENDNLYRKTSAKFQLSSDKFDFFYGVQAGDLGAVLAEDSQINGNVYSNGVVSGKNEDNENSVVTGDVIVAGSIVEDTNIQQLVCNTDQVVGKSGSEIDFAQSFTTGTSSATLAKVSLYIKKVGSPDSRKIRITTDNSGEPSSSDIAKGTLDKNLVSTSYGWVDVVLENPVTLSANTKYWIVFDAKKNNAKYWIWCKDSADSYSSGSIKYSKDWNDDPWNSKSGDFTFKTGFGSAGIISDMVILGDAKANTIVNSKICGDAYYKTIDQFSLDFLNSPTSPPCPLPTTPGTGYPNSPDPVPAPMPISDSNINKWKQDAIAGGTISGNYAVDSNVSLGPVYITGDLIMNNSNKTLTVTGVIYVGGNLDINNNSTIQCDSSFGSNSCIVVVDGWIHTDNNSNFSGSGSSNSFIMFVTTLNCDGSGTQTGCTHHNGAIDIHNDATGAVFYAPYGMVNLHDGVNVTQVTSYKLRADDFATITYDSGLPNANFSSGPSAGWKIYDWKEIK